MQIDLAPSAILIAVLLHRGSSVDAAVEGCRLRVDKLSVTFNLARRDAFIRLVRAVGITKPSKHYRESYACRGGLFVQHGPTLKRHGHRSSRLEFNPEDLRSIATKNTVRRLLSFAVPSSMRVSRIDVAVDLPVSLHDVQALGTSRNKVNTFIGPLGIETINIGARKSARQIRVYDKRQELIDKGLADEAYPLTTRFEAVLRNVKLPPADLANLENPFARLRLLHLQHSGLPFPRRLLVDYARVVGLPALKPELEPDEFAALVNDLEVSEGAPAVPHPKDVFDARWPDTAAELLHGLGLRRGHRGCR